MATLNVDNFGNDTADMLEHIQQQRSSLLGSLVDIHVGLGLLTGAEADRLAQKNGEDDPRVQLLRERSEAAAARVDALSVEQEIAAVRTPAPPAAGAVIQGRITDMMQRAAGRVSVQLVDSKGQPAAGVDTVEADDSGYYVFELTPEAVTAIGAGTVTVLVRGGSDQLVPAAAQAVTLAAGATVTQSIALNTTELERLKLRMPGTATAMTVKQQADELSATDKRAADEAAKRAADKAAADKATPNTNAAKSRSGKGSTDKA